MGLRTNRPRYLPIGVDLGTSCLRMAQLRTCATGVELVAAESAEVPPEYRDDSRRRMSFLSRQLSRMRKIGGFKGRRATLALPAGMVFVQPVRIPVLPEARADAAVRSEIARSLPYPLEDAVIRHVAARASDSDRDQMQERIVVAVPRVELERYMAMARAARLTVEGVTADVCAVADCFARLFQRASDESRTTLFLDVGHSSTQVVLCRGGTMIFARNLTVGGRELDQELASALQVSPEQAYQVRREMLAHESQSDAEEELLRLLEARIAQIAGDISDCLRYCEVSMGSRPIGRVVFLGGQAHDKRFCQCIAEQLNLPAQVGNPMVAVRPTGPRRQIGPLDLRRPCPAWAVAFGLSLGTAAA